MKGRKLKIIMEQIGRYVKLESNLVFKKHKDKIRKINKILKDLIPDKTQYANGVSWEFSRGYSSDYSLEIINSILTELQEYCASNNIHFELEEVYRDVQKIDLCDLDGFKIGEICDVLNNLMENGDLKYEDFMYESNEYGIY